MIRKIFIDKFELGKYVGIYETQFLWNRLLSLNACCHLSLHIKFHYK